MDALEAIVLGIVQGLTEFLPISSTGHLRIVPAFLGWDDPGAAFTAVTQLGTLAAVPGVSRSGATLTAGLFLNLERATAARYSFLLSVPAVVLSGLYELKDIGGEGAVGAAPTAIATVLAFVSGYAAIAFLLRFLATNSTLVFVVYRVALGALVLTLVSAGT